VKAGDAPNAPERLPEPEPEPRRRRASLIEAARSRIAVVGSALMSNLRSRDLRRAQLAFGAAWTSEWALTIGLSIVAFRDGGAAAVGLVALIRLLPGAIAGPFLATIADRVRRERVIVVIGLVRTACFAWMAVLWMAEAPIVTVYAVAIVSTIAGTPFRAAHSALLPSLCTTPEQLTSANVVRGMLDSLSMLVGPLVAAVLLALGTPATVFVAAALASLLSGLLVLHLDYDEPPRAVEVSRSTMVADVAQGMRELAARRDLALLIGLACSQTFTRGCVNVFAVVIAIDLLDMGEAGVGVLTAAIGVGAILGSLGASLLVTSHRLCTWYGLSILFWGLPLVLIGVFPQQGAALALLAVIGLANAVLDASGWTVIARLAPEDVLSSVFGLFESLVALTIGLGSILTPVVIDAVGVRGSLLVLGALCPLLALLSWRRLRGMDGSMRRCDEELELLQEVPMLRPLPVLVMDRLAHSLTEVHVAAGHAVFEQGSTGDQFYVIAAGEADVLGNGASIRTLGSGDSFGEIALLRDVARTTEVRARTDLDLFALDRDVFVPAVSGYRPASAEADTVVASRLHTFRPA
jgi:MFS family permease